MEANRKGRLQNFKDKTRRMLKRIRRRAAPEKKSGVKETLNPQPPPLSTSEESEMSICDNTVDLPKPQDNPSTNTSTKEQSSTTSDVTSVDIASVDSKKRLQDMPSEAHQRLTVLLEPLDVLGNDYRKLADKMGYPNDYIKYLGSTKEPVKTLIKEKGDMKIVKLITLLEDMDRQDVAQELQEFLKVTRTPEQREQLVKTREKNLKLMTLRECYDAFICFAKKDGHFVDKLVKKMEKAPYHLHLCLSERDFMPGGSIYDITAEAIEQRCKKFVVILSSNFDDSDGAHYESQIAMSLSPGAKEKRLIPILIEEEYRGKIPRTLSHITYLDRLRQEENDFWKKLAESLGWNPK